MKLTPAELAALLGAAAGETAAETARRTGRSPETVKTQRKRVLWKLGGRNMTHAVAIAYDRGLLGKRDEAAPPMSEGQARALYAKASLLGKHLCVAKAIVIDQVRAQASEQFGRTFSTVEEFDTRHAHWVLDRLEERLALVEHEAAFA